MCVVHRSLKHTHTHTINLQCVCDFSNTPTVPMPTHHLTVLWFSCFMFRIRSMLQNECCIILALGWKKLELVTGLFVFVFCSCFFFLGVSNESHQHTVLGIFFLLWYQWPLFNRLKQPVNSCYFLFLNYKLKWPFLKGDFPSGVLHTNIQS